MKKFCTLTLLSVLLFLGCTKDAQMESQNEEPRLSLYSEGYRVSEADAAAILTNHLELLNEEEATTRSYRTITVGKPAVIVNQAPSTRSREINADTLMYLFNFDDGYAIMAADKRLAPVIAIVDEGSLSAEYFELQESDPQTRSDDEPSEITSLEEFNAFIGNTLMIYAISEVESYDEEKVPETRLFGDPYYYTIHKYGPHLRTVWDQGSPFNYYVPNSWYTGCVPTAIAQVCAYHGFPKTFRNVEYNWTNMRKVYSYYTPGVLSKGTANQQQWVAHFMYLVGLDAKATYKSTGTSTAMKDAEATMKRMGFKGVSRYVNFHVDLYQNGAKNGAPVVASAKGPNIHHAFVVDGWWYVGHSKALVAVNLMHCNYGWSGTHNGWYQQGVWDMTKRAWDFDSSIGDKGSNYGHYGKYFTSEWRVIKYNRP